MRTFRWLLVCLGWLIAFRASPAVAAEGYDFEVPNPSVRIRIAGLPGIPMERHPLASTQPHARFIGSDGKGTTISILMPTADAGMGPLECAGSQLRSVSRRFGLKRGEFIARKLDDTTFMMLFVKPVEGVIMLQAYLFSAAGGTHCVEVHASRISTKQSDVEPWFKTFDGANISAGQ